MSILTLKFFLFLAITVVTYYLCVPKLRWVVILVANIGFFISATGIATLIVFTTMVLATWGASLLLKSIKSEKIKKAVTAGAILVLLITLILYKELSFFLINAKLLGSFVRLSFDFALPDWVAPLGISYYTLILIGYLLDVRWGTIAEPQKNPFKFITFSGYFPHMTSGPFTRYNDVKDTLFGEVKFHPSTQWRGFQRILWGLFKVIVISTRLSVLVETIYHAQTLPMSENHFTGIAVLIGAMLYILYIYMNFSGSMDIVIGASELFGIPLAENFQRPFSATNLSELWRRWHMTLGFWLKDYVLYPTLKSGWMNKIRSFCKTHLGKKASKDIPTYIGMFISWFCVGFWHGGLWKYIFGSGLFFFIMIVGGLILHPFFKKIIKICRINTECYSWRGFQRVRTFLLFVLAVSFGRAASFHDGFSMWHNLFIDSNIGVLFDGTIFNMGLTGGDLFIALMGLVVVFFVSHLQQKHGDIRTLLTKQNILFQISIVVVLFALVFLIGGMDNSVDLMYGKF